MHTQLVMLVFVRVVVSVNRPGYSSMIPPPHTCTTYNHAYMYFHLSLSLSLTHTHTHTHTCTLICTLAGVNSLGGGGKTPLHKAVSGVNAQVSKTVALMLMLLILLMCMQHTIILATV